MAERRRRRSNECDSESEHTEPVLSEYESTADESRDVEETEEDTDTEEYVTEDEETAEEEDGDKKEKSGTVDGERQSGDGEEQPKLDIDEDRQHHAYIPKRGAFYEHDMRLDPDEEIKEGGDQQREERRSKGKLWKDESKWTHDRFDNYDQAPKSRQELITMYGYDITQSNQPPDQAPNTGGRPRRGGRDRKPQFQDFLPDSDKGRPSYASSRNRYDEDGSDDRGPQQSKSDTFHYRGGRGRRGPRHSEGGPPRRGYSDFNEDRAPRNRGFSEQGREGRGLDRDDRDHDSDFGNRDNFRNKDNFGDRDQDRFENRDRDNFGNRGRGNFGNRERGHFANRNRDNYENREKDNVGNRDRENFGNRGRGNFGNRGRGNFGDRERGHFANRNRDNNENRERDNVGNRDRENFENRNRDNYGNREKDNYGSSDNFRNKEQYDNESPYGKGKQDLQDHPEYRGGFRGRGRGGFRDNRRENRRDVGNRDNADQENGNRSARENVKYERQYSGGRDGENQVSRLTDASSRSVRSEAEPPLESTGSRFRSSDVMDRVPTRSYDKPAPKSYYTLSVTDDEKLLGEMDDVEDSPPAKSGVQDLNVTVTGDRRSFNKDRPRPPRSQDYVKQSSVEERRDDGTTQGSSGVSKHQPTLPPRLQLQQQQQEHKRQQQPVFEKQDPTQTRSKRYSSQRQRNAPEAATFSEPHISQPSQRQRNVPEGPGFSEPQISQPSQQIVTSPFQQHFQPNFSPPKPAVAPLSVIIRPTISPQMPAPPQQPTVGSPTVIPLGPPPPTMIAVPGSQVLPPQVRPPLPPPPTGPPGAPRVFPAGAIPSSGLPAVSVIAAPLISPAGIVYAAPPPAFQVPVPQFSTAPPVQPQQPSETVRGGTTYYPQAPPGTPTSPGTTYYSPEMQMVKQNRVQVRRPKVPLSIVNPEEMKKRGDLESYSKDMEDDSMESYLEYDPDDEDAIQDEQIDSGDDYIAAEPDDEKDRLETDSEQLHEHGEVVSEDKHSEAFFENVKIESAFIENEEQYIQEQKCSEFSETDLNEAMDVKNEERTVCINEDSGNLVIKTERVEIEEQSGAAECRKQNIESTNTHSGDEDDARHSTFVVKTDILSPTLSVSTVIPDKLRNDEVQNESVKMVVSVTDNEVQSEPEKGVENITENVNVIDMTGDKQGEVGMEVGQFSLMKTMKETKDADESGESFEDAVEEVNEGGN